MINIIHSIGWKRIIALVRVTITILILNSIVIIIIYNRWIHRCRIIIIIIIISYDRYGGTRVRIIIITIRMSGIITVVTGGWSIAF